MEARLVLAGHAEQLADDRHRQRVGEIVDDIELALVALGIEQLVDEGDDAVVHGVDASRGELAHHQPPQSVVLGRVEEEEWPWLDALRTGEGNLGLALVLAHPRVVQQGGDRRVAC